METLNQAHAVFRRDAAACFARTARRHLRNYRPDMYREFAEKGELLRHVQELGTEAAARQEVMEAQYLKKNPWPGGPSERAQHLAWAALIAQEIVMDEMILLPDEETARAIRRGGYQDEG